MDDKDYIIISSSSGREKPDGIITAVLKNTVTTAAAVAAALPESAAPGSAAFTGDGEHFFVKGVEGQWNDWLAESTPGT